MRLDDSVLSVTSLEADPSAQTPARRSLRERLSLGGALAGALIWLGLAAWRLGSVPGMTLDEAWSVLCARGDWLPADPLSGMSRYSGPIPVLLLKLLGTSRAVWVLRGASVLANGAALLLLGRLLRRVVPAWTLAGWALPLIATCPVWLVMLRTGIEVLMFTPLLTIAGLYLLQRGTPRAAFGGGVLWGLLIYNHVVGLCFPLGLALAWFGVYRRAPAIPLRAALAGLLLGLAPRLLALVLYHDRGLAGPGESWALLPALGDLRWLPGILWRTWHGDLVYLRHVGRIAVEVWPYNLLLALLVVPWVKHRWRVPRYVWFTLLAALASAVLVTLEAPYMAVRFLILPIVGTVAGLTLLGAAAIERDRRWRWLVRGAVGSVVAMQLAYVVGNYYLPWQRGELEITTFWLGDRSKSTSSWAYLPKEALVRELMARQAPPSQIVTVPTLERPLRVLLGEARVALTHEAEPLPGSVLLDYRNAPRKPRCVGAGGAPPCFGSPVPIGGYYLLYP